MSARFTSSPLRAAREMTAGFAGDVACGAHVAEMWLARQAGPEAIERLASHRLRQLVDFARRRSPFYQERFAGVDRHKFTLRDLPVVTREEVMAHFDDVVTDRRLRLPTVERFLGRRDEIGRPIFDRYYVWKSSGTRGAPGVFVEDIPALAVYGALITLQSLDAPLDPGRLLAGGNRAAIVVATGDHYASIASWERLRRTHPGWNARSFSVLTPLQTLIEALNDYRPGFLAGYPSILASLAEEKARGRLRIEPARVWSGGEFLAVTARHGIEAAFGCPVIDEYGASECLSIAQGCGHGWMHVNADWVMLEGVEADGSPTPAGRLSHGTLLTNLANRVQPLIRYQLGDRIVTSAEPCPCGNRLPAIRVEGRCDDVLSLQPAHGRSVRLPPLALETLIEEASGVHRFQVVQTGDSQLAVRLEPRDQRVRRRAWHAAELALRGYLARQGLDNVRVELDPEPPRIDARSGKLRCVVREMT